MIHLNPYPEMNDEYIERLRVVINGYREIAALYVLNHTIIRQFEVLDGLAWDLGIGVGVQPGGEMQKEVPADEPL